MPIVHIHLEPRDEESKARIAREVSAAIAEGTNNSLSSIIIVFHELPASAYATGLNYLPRMSRASGASPDLPSFATLHACNIQDENDFMRLRNEVVHPALAQQKGFVSTMILRMREPKGSYFLMNKWMSQADWEAWGTTEADRSTTAAQLELAQLWDPAPFSWSMDIVNHKFGRHGGARL